MQLLIVRHAESTNNRLYATSGADAGRVVDPDITDLGRRQAEALARVIAASPYPAITHLYSSLMRRTIQTAAPLAAALDLPIVARSDAYEHPGPFDGPHSARVVDPGTARSVLQSCSARVQLPETATEQGWFTGVLEDQAGLEARADALLADLRAHHAETDVVALVTHGWFASVVIGRAVGARADAWFMHQNTATTLLSWDTWVADGETEARPQTSLLWTNRHDHLAAADVSQ